MRQLQIALASDWSADITTRPFSRMQTVLEADLRNFETLRGRSKFWHIHSMAPEAKQVTRAWEALTPPLSEWVLDAISSMGFLKMTPVQANCIPLFMGNKDVVVEVRDLMYAE